MKLIDTHTHLFLKQFDEDRDEVIGNALNAGVYKMLLPNVDSTTLDDLFNLYNQYSNSFIIGLGLHPGSVKDNFKLELDVIGKAFNNLQIKAVGEVGIDLYWDKTYKQEQIQAFKMQIEWALEKELPLIVHNRDAFDIIIEVLKTYKTQKWKGIFHCFTGTNEQAEVITNMGFLIGIGGVITFKNSGLADVVKNISLDSIVLETDSPYLAPVPRRGKRNESAYLVYIVEKIAEIYNISNENAAEITTANAIELFDIQ